MDERQEIFQIATLIVVVITALVCMCYVLVFINPQIALNPLKPATEVPTAVAGLPATWTPVPTSTATPTNTPTRTPTLTLTPVPTNTPTNTPIPSPTRRLPTRTPRPPAPPPPVSSGYAYNVVSQGCFHAGGTFIEGTVWGSSGGSPQAGIRIAMGSGPGPGTGDVYYVTSGTAGKSDGYYVHVINGGGASPGNYYVWVADASGNPLSNPSAGHVTTNNIRNGDDPAACWRAVMDFVRR